MTFRLAWRPALVTVLALLLFGCGSADDRSNDFAAPVKAGAAKLAAKLTGRDAASAELSVTRAQVSAIPSPLLLVRFEDFNNSAGLVPVGSNGDVVTWGSNDGKTLSLRQGMVVATRGFGSDLMSAAVPTSAEVAGGTGLHNRIHYYLNGVDSSTRQPFTCYMTSVGTEAITIVERRYSTRHVRETCKGPTGSHVNDYWFENGSYLRQSRQWISQRLGFVQIARLND